MEMITKAATIKSLNADENEIAKINCFTLKELTAEDVFIFKVIACSNEIDRDMESFTTSALKTLGEMYCGKTMIFDHRNTTENQVARIYDTEIVEDAAKTTKLGEPYTTLVLHVFIPRIAKNADLITEIETGIKKEVSVGCRCNKRVCSICGMSEYGYRNPRCGHESGQEYDGKIRAIRLDEVADAYEVSFVAVPAQKDAGTTKTKDTVHGGLPEENPPQTRSKSVFKGFLKFLCQ